METNTHYRLLGIPSNENPQGIRAAYGDLVRKLCHGVAGERSARALLEIAEAYDVLSDPQRRRDYNAELRQPAHGDVVAVRHGSRAPLVLEPFTILGTEESIRPSFESMYDRFLRNFTGSRVPKSERPEGLNFEILLSWEEASRGCIVPIGVPVFSRCPYCEGSGRNWMFPCVHCQQQGMVESRAIVRIDIPPMSPAGSIFEVSLEALGIYNFYLRLHLVVVT